MNDFKYQNWFHCILVSLVLSSDRAHRTPMIIIIINISIYYTRRQHITRDNYNGEKILENKN